MERVSSISKNSGTYETELLTISQETYHHYFKTIQFYFQFVTYPKSRGDSGIRVMISICLRAHRHHAGGCNMWYLTFNQDRCTNPESLAAQDYSANTGDFHFASSSMWHCSIPVESLLKHCWNTVENLWVVFLNTK